MLYTLPRLRALLTLCRSWSLLEHQKQPETATVNALSTLLLALDTGTLLSYLEAAVDAGRQNYERLS